MYIWDKLCGREVSRFLSGNHFFDELETLKLSHKHTIQALILLDKRYIGSLKNHQVLFSNKGTLDISTKLDELSFDDATSRLTYELPSNDKYQAKVEITPKMFSWRLTKSVCKSSSIFINHFEAEDFWVKCQPIKAKNFGRCFILRTNSPGFDGLFRHYTMVLSLTPSNISWRATILNFVEQKMSQLSSIKKLGEPTRAPQHDPPELRSAKIILVMRLENRPQGGMIHALIQDRNRLINDRKFNYEGISKLISLDVDAAKSEEERVIFL